LTAPLPPTSRPPLIHLLDRSDTEAEDLRRVLQEASGRAARLTTTTTSTTPPNGKLRRTLAEQIDRLDQVLDGLADYLNEAVAGAVTKATATAVQAAVQQALAEVLTNPDVLALLGGVVRLHEPPAPSGVGPCWNTVKSWLGKQLSGVKAAAVAAGMMGMQLLDGLRAKLLGLWRYRVPVLLALGAGAAVGLAAYAAGPWVAGLFGMLAGLVSSWAGRAWDWLTKALRGVRELLVT
jgi:hypothetical protein